MVARSRVGFLPVCQRLCSKPWRKTIWIWKSASSGARTMRILGIRNVRLAPELGRPDAFEEAFRAALNAGRVALAQSIGAIGRVHRALYETRLQALEDLARTLAFSKNEVEPWLLIEIGSKAAAWVEELESALVNGHNATVLLSLLPPLYEVLGIPNHAVRTQGLQQRAVQLLMKERHFAKALDVLRSLSERQPKLEASCQQALGDFRGAAESHLAAGNLREALTCYRSVPDLERALKLVDQIGEYPAAKSLQWIAKLQELVAERPEKFTKLVTPAEKELLQDLLEKALGASRRKPVARGAKVKKTTAPKRPKQNSAGGKPRV